MNRLRKLAFALLAATTLLGCSQSPAPPAAPGASDDAPKTVIGRQVAKGIEEASRKLATSNISINDGIDININGHKIHRPQGVTKAEISPQGDLLLDGKAQVVTPAQRAELMRYRAQVIAIAVAGMAVGVKGADIAGEAIAGVAGAIFSGEAGAKEFEQRMEAKGASIEAEAMKICAQLPSLLESQRRLADSLPAFKPYATMTQADVDECGKDGEGAGHRDAERTRVREEVRSEIRDTIRDTIRAAVPGG